MDSNWEKREDPNLYLSESMTQTCKEAILWIENSGEVRLKKKFDSKDWTREGSHLKRREKRASKRKRL